MGTSISYTTNRDKLVHTNTNMKVLVIVATLLSCSLAAPTELLKAYELPKVETIEYKAVAHPFLGYHGLPLAHAVKEVEGEEVAAHALPYLSPFPYHHGPVIAPAVVKEGEEVEALPVLHAAPHHYPAEVRTLAINHEPVVIPHVEPKVVEGAVLPSVVHTSYHAETKRVEHPVNINHHSVQHVQKVVHTAPAVVHHAAPAVYHHAAPAVYHHALPVHHVYAVKVEEAEE